MARATSALLTDILYRAKKVDTVEQIINEVESMCKQKDIEHVNSILARERKEDTK